LGKKWILSYDQAYLIGVSVVLRWVLSFVSRLFYGYDLLPSRAVGGDIVCAAPLPLNAGMKEIIVLLMAKAIGRN